MTMIISYSEVVKWQTCQRAYYYRYSLGRSPIEESDAISTGVKGHTLLQNFYTLMREEKAKEEALELTAKSAMTLVNKDQVIDFNLLKAWTLVDNYIRATDFTSESELIENRFLIPVSAIWDDSSLDHVQIGFTPDLVTRRTGNFLDVEDAKFVARAWSKSKLNRFSQAKLYQIFLSRMGYNISRSAIRFFNVTTGKISTQNYVMNKEEERILLRDFMAGVAEVVKFREKVDYIKAEAPRTMNNTACQFCQFEYPCSLEAEGKDASKTLLNLYQVSTYDYTR